MTVKLWTVFKFVSQKPTHYATSRSARKDVYGKSWKTSVFEESLSEVTLGHRRISFSLKCKWWKRMQIRTSPSQLSEPFQATQTVHLRKSFVYLFIPKDKKKKKINISYSNSTVVKFMFFTRGKKIYFLNIVLTW